MAVWGPRGGWAGLILNPFWWWFLLLVSKTEHLRLAAALCGYCGGAGLN